MVNQPHKSEVNTDNDGFLADVDNWSREVAEFLAKVNNIGDPELGLSDQHWKVIQFVHDYYQQHNRGPAIVTIGKALGIKSATICDLFPCGVARGAYRLAGLPRPPGCL